MSIFRYFLLSLAQERTSNFNLVDAYILLFKEDGCEVAATWHLKKIITNWCDILYTHKSF